MDFQEALAYLDEHMSYQKTGRIDSPSVEPITAICSALGDPHLSAPVIHVTGTNGKGSTVQMISRLLAAQGLTVGTYTSPHLEHVTERFKRNGEPITEEELAEQISAVAEIAPLVGQDPGYFEILTAAAFRWFADIAVDVMVIEVGLLGRWDATNIVESQVAVITNIGMDHNEFAGPSIRDVATEKSGIVKPGSAVIVGETDPELVDIFRNAGGATTFVRDEDFATLSNSLAVNGRLLDLRTPTTIYTDVFLPLNGAHQGDNAALALAAVETFFAAPLPEDVVIEGFAEVTMPGRFEVLGRQPLVIVDGAHNSVGADNCASVFFGDFHPDGRRILVVGNDSRTRWRCCRRCVPTSSTSSSWPPRRHRAACRRPTSLPPPKNSAATTSSRSTTSRPHVGVHSSTPTVTTRSSSPAASTPPAPPAPSSPTSPPESFAGCSAWESGRAPGRFGRLSVCYRCSPRVGPMNGHRTRHLAIAAGVAAAALIVPIAAADARIDPGLPTTVAVQPVSSAATYEMAYNPERDEYLAVWRPRTDPADEIFVARLDSEGNRLSGPTVIAETGADAASRFQSQGFWNPNVAYDSASNQYLVVLQRGESILALGEDARTAVITGQLVSDLGVPVGGEVALNPSFGTMFALRPAVSRRGCESGWRGLHADLQPLVADHDDQTDVGVRGRHGRQVDDHGPAAEQLADAGCPCEDRTGLHRDSDLAGCIPPHQRQRVRRQFER